MKKKKLGKLEVSSLCLGGNVFGWTIDEATSFQVLDAFVAGGGNFIDTADVYSRWVPGHKGGESEAIIGRWMRARNNRDQIIVATKVGMDMGDGNKGLKKDYILKSAEDSLRRLQTDYIDLYISHTPDEATPIEETMEAYSILVKQGKIRVVGASNYKAQGLREAIEYSKKTGLPAYESLQNLYNLYDRHEFEKNVLPVCQEYNIAVTPYYALASGFLTGKYRSQDDIKKSPRGQKAATYLTDRGLRILEALDVVSKEVSGTPAEVAIAWLISRPFMTAPIASATSTSQVETLIKASHLQLPPSALKILDKASAE